MSVLECNLVSGDGDGVRRAFYEKSSSKRTPVPSCRRFTARAQPGSDDVKRKLDAALRQTSASTPLRCSRKRSLTMAEITPTKKKNEDLRLAGDSATRAPVREDDAGRRVYQQLLLNAWRQRRVQVATLSDSSTKLQSQVDQLQIQVDVLQKLRESESKKRLASANEGAQLKSKKDGLLKTVDQLQKDEILLKGHVERLQQKIEDLNAVTHNVKSDLIRARNDVAAYEEQLCKERLKNVKLSEEKQNLIDQLAEKDYALTEQGGTINQLKEAMELSEKKLECANLNNGNLTESKTMLTMKLERETESKANLEKEFIETKIREDKLERKIFELKKNITVLADVKKKLQKDNQIISKALEDFETAVKEEREKIWWKTATAVFLESLHNAAKVLLPAYPKKVDKNSSTTSLE